MEPMQAKLDIGFRDDEGVLGYCRIHGNLVDFYFVFEKKHGAKVLKNHKILEWCKGKNVELEKR